MNGKGDDPRPYSVDYKTYSQNFERTFGKHPREKESTTEVTKEVTPEVDPEADA